MDRAAPNRRRWRLLPDSPEIGWLPYVWLIYLAYVFIAPIVDHAGAVEWAFTLLPVAGFLPLYFLGHWWHGPKVLWLVAGMVALGMIYTPWNTGGVTFIIYAGFFLGETESEPLVWKALAVIIAAFALESWLLRINIIGVLSGVVFCAFGAMVSLQRVQRGRANRKVRMAQDEVERLAKIAERERIARDLHDLLGHTLSLIVLKSELASKLAEKDAVRAAAEIKDVERISREALAQVRAAVRGYRATGLRAEIDEAGAALRAAGIEFNCDMPDARLAPSQESALAFAVREAVTNIVRHSGARSCRLALRFDSGTCEMAIDDDGRGGSAAEGCGLSGMRERVQALGGTLERSGARGTSLRIRIPLQAASGAA